MYQYQNNILSIPAKLIYEDWELVSYDNFKQLCSRGKLIKTKSAGGLDTMAWVSVYDLPVHRGVDFKQICFKNLGNPKEVVVTNLLENYMMPDTEAARFFGEHRKPNGKPLSDEDKAEKTTNAIVLNAIQMVFNDPKRSFKRGLSTEEKWTEVAKSVNALSTTKWKCSLPGNWRRLKDKFEKYSHNRNYKVLLHKGEGQKNRHKIKGEIADFLLAKYSLPIKLSIPEVLVQYNREAIKKEWPSLTEQAVYYFLNQPENERIWTLGRHGLQAYNKKYKHTITRDKSNWFPNAFWVIDGTKLDWIHVWDEASNKLGAKLKIDLCFDVYSEKIIGYDLSFTESYLEHFRTIKMAVNEAQVRPYYINYDNQGGHTTDRMQAVYDSLVAENKGSHHPNKAREHSNPAEQLIGRFQKQVVTKFWFSDGQNITVKRDDSKMNVDFIAENKAFIKTIDELKKAWKAAVYIWNNSKHPHFNGTRNEVYNHKMPMNEPLTLWQIMDKMWLEESKRLVTYKASGLKINISGEDYEFEVLDAHGNIDEDFRYENVGRKFKVRYDPDFLDGYVQLYQLDEKNNYVWVANAQPKQKIQNIPALMQEGDKEKALAAMDLRKRELERTKKELKALEDRTGINRQTLIEDTDLLIKMGGNTTKVERLLAESLSTEYDF